MLRIKVSINSYQHLKEVYYSANNEMGLKSRWNHLKPTFFTKQSRVAGEAHTCEGSYAINTCTAIPARVRLAFIHIWVWKTDNVWHLKLVNSQVLNNRQILWKESSGAQFPTCLTLITCVTRSTTTRRETTDFVAGSPIQTNVNGTGVKACEKLYKYIILLTDIHFSLTYNTSSI